MFIPDAAGFTAADRGLTPFPPATVAGVDTAGMTRRILGIIGVAGAVLGAVVSLGAQDVQYIRAIERAQQQRPASLTSTARIAPAAEPGTPLIVRGRLLNVDGSPAAGATVFAYQTDRAGLYDKPENGPHSWRLRGWARTGDHGRFIFETIRPGSYPNSNNPPHIHFTAFLPGGERYHAGELQLSMTRAAGTPSPESAAIDLRLDARQKF